MMLAMMMKAAKMTQLQQLNKQDQNETKRGSVKAEIGQQSTLLLQFPDSFGAPEKEPIEAY